MWATRSASWSWPATWVVRRRPRRPLRAPSRRVAAALPRQHNRALFHGQFGHYDRLLERLRDCGPDACGELGAWSNSPTGFSYQWERCATASAQPPTTGSCSAISGATGSAYTVQSADVGHSLVPVVTANNAAGASSPTGLAGTCDTGEMLGVTAGSFSSSVPTSVPAGCSPVSAVVGTTQAGEKFCTNAVTTCGFADPLNQTVGVPSGVTPSTTGACAAYTNGARISSGTVTINGCKITGQIYVSGGTVTVENSDLSVNDESGASAPIEAHGGTVIAEYDTIHGLGPTTSGSMAWAIYDCCRLASGDRGSCVRL